MFCFILCSKMTKAVRTTQHTIQGRNYAAKDTITEEEDEAPGKTIYLRMCGREVWNAEGMCAGAPRAVKRLDVMRCHGACSVGVGLTSKRQFGNLTSVPYLYS